MEIVLTALRAAGEPTRLRILAILAKGELTVSELTQVLLQSQPRISRHLKLLADAGLVQRYPEGSWVFYRLHESGPVGALLAEIIRNLPRDDHDIQRDSQRLAEVREDRAARAQVYFAENAANWDSLRAQHIPETEVEAEIADLMAEDGMELLVDLGTGTGRMLEVFGERATRAIGFDVSPNMLALARTNLDEARLSNCQVRQGDCTNVPLEDASANVVILHQVLHFLDDPQRAISEASRILVPGGQVLVADFGPHELEELRDAHAHRRLGFADTDMQMMMRQVGLVPLPAIQLSSASHQLTVALWQAEKPKADKQSEVK